MDTHHKQSPPPTSFNPYHILHTTTKPASPHLSLRHLIQSYHTLHPSSSNGYTPSTLLHQTSPQPCNTHTHQHPANLLLHHNITSTQYPYDLPTYYTPPTFTTHPNTHPPTLYTPSNTLHAPIPIHTLQPSTHLPTPYTPSNTLHTLQPSPTPHPPSNAPNTPSNT